MLAGAARAKAAQAYSRSSGPSVSTAAMPSPQSGDRLGEHFVLHRPIGEGGAGVVWEAVDLRTNQPIALKLLRSGDSHALRRFLREARVATALRHPNLVPVLDAFVDADSGRGVLAMERLHGASLADVLFTRGALPAREVVAIGIGVAAGLAAVHALGVVHRDLKPANVFVRHAAQPDHVPIRTCDIVVLDFGIAKLTADAGVAANTGALTRSGTLLGTPHYMAPEQVRAGAVVDSSADVWALGVLLYEAISGVRPIEGLTALDVSRALLHPRIEPLADRCPSLSATVAASIERMLTPRSADRPSMADVESQLRRETALVDQEQLW